MSCSVAMPVGPRALAPLFLLALLFCAGASVAEAQPPRRPARISAGFGFGMGTLGSTTCLYSSDNCATGRLTVAYGGDVRYLTPSMHGVLARARVMLIPDAQAFVGEVGYAPRLVLHDEGTGHAFDLAITLATARVAYGGGTPDHWSFGLGGSIAYAFRFGPASLSGGPFGYVLPVSSGRTRALYAVGFELRMGVDLPLR